MLRRIYIRYKQLRGQHVLAHDCWCDPVIEYCWQDFDHPDVHSQPR